MKSKVVLIENNLISSLTMRDRLTRELMQHYDVTILATGNDKQKKEAAERGFKVIEVGASNQNILHVWHYLRNLRRALKTIKPDVCLTFTIRPAIWGNLVTRSLGIPTITSITGIGPLFTQEALAYKAARFLYRFALNKTRLVIFQNQDDRALFIKNRFVPSAKTNLVPGSGVDADFFAPAPVSQEQPFSFLFIGRLVKDKGVREFVEAAGMLRQRNLPVSCHILGPYWTQNLKDNNVSEQEMAEWMATGNIHYLGEAGDVRPYMAKAHCIVLPSYREGLNNVLLEASSMQRPCISTDTTGCREVIDHNITGFLCKVKDSADLADQMERMFRLSADERADMALKARQKVIREFDKKIVVEAYQGIIKKILQTD